MSNAEMLDVQAGALFAAQCWADAADVYDVAADAWEECGERMRAWNCRWFADLCRKDVS
jgi:hypothetical protein